jgi:glycosyltransferase involved in cell wall biosynthesis
MRGVSVFYKTYGPDLKWLRYSLLSLKKFCKDPYELIIAVEDSAEDALRRIVEYCKLDARILPIQYELHGYFEQQLAKLEAYKWCSHEMIVMMDSDAIFQIPFSFSDFLTPDGKILWNICKPEDAGEIFGIWKQGFESMTKQPYTIYTMCNNPYILTRTALQNAQNTFEELHSCSYRDYVRGCNKKHDFSEYLWLGWWCKNYSKDHYMPIVSPKEAWNHPQVHQFISVGSFADARPILESVVKGFAYEE